MTYSYDGESADDHHLDSFGLDCRSFCTDQCSASLHCTALFPTIVLLCSPHPLEDDASCTELTGSVVESPILEGHPGKIMTNDANTAVCGQDIPGLSTFTKMQCAAQGSKNQSLLLDLSRCGLTPSKTCAAYRNAFPPPIYLVWGLIRRKVHCSSTPRKEQ